MGAQVANVPIVPKVPTHVGQPFLRRMLSAMRRRVPVMEERMASSSAGVRAVERRECAAGSQVEARAATGGVHAFADAAVEGEVGFEMGNLPGEEVGEVADEADEEVRGGFGGGGCEAGGEGVPSGVAAEAAGGKAFGGVFGPLGEGVEFEVVEVVFEEFFEAGFGDVGEGEFGGFAGGGGFAAFDDVLFAAAGGLLHLADGTVARLEGPADEDGGAAEDEVALAVGDESFVAAVGRDDGAGHGKGLLGL